MGGRGATRGVFKGRTPLPSFVDINPSISCEGEEGLEISEPIFYARFKDCGADQGYSSRRMGT